MWLCQPSHVCVLVYSSCTLTESPASRKIVYRRDTTQKYSLVLSHARGVSVRLSVSNISRTAERIFIKFRIGDFIAVRPVYSSDENGSLDYRQDVSSTPEAKTREPVVEAICISSSSSSSSLAQQPILSQGLLQNLLPAVPIPCSIPPISLPQLPGIFPHTIFPS